MWPGGGAAGEAIDWSAGGIGICSTQPFIHSLIHSVHSRNGLSDTKFCDFDPVPPEAHALADTSVSSTLFSQVWCDSVLQKGIHSSFLQGPFQVAPPLNSAAAQPQICIASQLAANLIPNPFLSLYIHLGNRVVSQRH